MRKTLIALATAALTGLSGNAAASGIPTVDVAALAQNIVDMANQIQQLEQALTQVQQGVMQIEEARNQVLEAQRAFDSLNGIRDLGSLLNSDIYRAARNYLPAGWEDTIRFGNDISNGRYSSLRGFSEALRQGDRLYANRGDLYLPDNSPELAYMEQRETAVNKERTESEMALQVTDARFSELGIYKDRINSLPDQKSTLDLQASMMAESLMLQNELIKMQNQRNLSEANALREEQQRRERNLRLTHLPYDPTAANERARAQMAYD